MPNLIAVGQTVRDFPEKLDPSRPSLHGHSRSSKLTKIDRVPKTSY